MTAREREELDARQQQGMARRGGQQGLGDQEGGLFAAERDQGSLFSRADDLPTVSINSSDWGKFGSGNTGFAVLRTRVSRWYDGIVGTTVQSADGKTVHFNSVGRKKTLRAGEDLLRVARAIPSIIERGSMIGSEPSNRPGMKAIHRYAANFRDASTDKILPVVLIVREANDGMFHYSLNKYGERLRGSDASAVAEGEAKRSFSPALEGDTEPNINLDFYEAGVNSSVQEEANETALRARLVKLGLSEKVALEIVDSLGGGVAGSYAARLIRIARDTAQDASFTLDHEAVHAMREMGLFATTNVVFPNRRSFVFGIDERCRGTRPRPAHHHRCRNYPAACARVSGTRIYRWRIRNMPAATSISMLDSPIARS